MSKKYAFIVIQKLPRKMVLFKESKYINATIAANNSEVGND